MVRIEAMPRLGGWYNVRPEEIPDQSGSQPEAGPGVPASGRLVWSVAELPPAGSRERERRALYPVLGQTIAQALADDAVPEHNDVLEPVFGRFSIGEFSDHREMRFCLGSPAALRPLLIGRLQSLLHERFPLWRLVPQYEELEIGVYPEGVRIGDDLVPGTVSDDDPHLARWIESARRLHEQKFGALRRQLAFLGEAVPLAAELARSQGFAALGAFDWHRCSDDIQTPILWLLETREVADAFTLDVFANGQPLERLHRYPVDERGTILPPGTDDATPLVLRGDLPSTAADHFDLKLKRGHWPVVARATIERVTTDAELTKRGYR